MRLCLSASLPVPVCQPFCLPVCLSAFCLSVYLSVCCYTCPAVCWPDLIPASRLCSLDSCLSTSPHIDDLRWLLTGLHREGDKEILVATHPLFSASSQQNLVVDFLSLTWLLAFVPRPYHISLRLLLSVVQLYLSVQSWCASAYRNGN